ncbi:MAG: hypothetical protein WB523_06845 [Candidatus Sulfotelmatobacter sp.]
MSCRLSFRSYAQFGLNGVAVGLVIWAGVFSCHPSWAAPNGILRKAPQAVALSIRGARLSPPWATNTYGTGTPTPKFSATLGPVFWNAKRDAISGWWIGDVVSGGSGEIVKEIHPANVSAYVTATNLQSAEALIEYYGLQVRTKRGQWVDLIRMDAVNAAAFLVFEDAGLKAAHLCRVRDLFDKSVMAGEIIKPGQIFKGWVFFEYPKKYADETFVPVFRFKLRAVGGADYTSPEQTLPQKGPASPFELQGGGVEPIQRMDISGVPITFLDPGK